VSLKVGLIILAQSDLHDKIIDLAKRRGIFWPSFEIYGGVAGFYDFGPVGVFIKRSIIDLWLKFFVYSQENVIEIETPIINPRVVFKASGHEEHFTDPVVECSSCGKVFRADHLVKEFTGIDVEGRSLREIDEVIRKYDLKCPECGGIFKPASSALLLFATEIGPYKGSPGYLRPEHAQGMFINFAKILRVVGEKLPLGLAQVGKVARNEISPRQALLRLREFTIMEVEFFFDPERESAESKNISESVMNEKLRVVTADMRMKGIEEPIEITVKELIENRVVKSAWLAYWMGIGNLFVKSLGIPAGKIRFFEKLPHERAHYSAQTFDQEVYTSRYGWIEVAGYAYRTTYDLERHAEFSKADLTYYRKYEAPIIKTIEVAYPNPQEILKLLGASKYSEVMRELSQHNPEELFKELLVNNSVVAAGISLPRECFIIKKEEVKIHGEKIYPHVVEPSFGVERLFYVVLEYAYSERDGKVVLKLPPHIAPYHVAVFPLVAGKKPEHQRMIDIAKSIYRDLVKRGFRVLYDEEGSIGKRYARVDEIGVPYAVTVDYQTLEDNTVTVRDRDTTQQIRININKLPEYLNTLILRELNLNMFQ
jgi:glycyl-tRNA synthetase